MVTPFRQGFIDLGYFFFYALDHLFGVFR